MNTSGPDALSALRAHPLLFTREEFLARCRRLQQHMEEQQLDLVILDQPELIFHYVGHAMSEGLRQACLIPCAGEPVMVLRTVDEGACRQRSWLHDIIGFADWDDPLDVVATVVRNKGWNSDRIGVDENSYNLTVRRYRALQRAFPDSLLLDISGYTAQALACKSPAEIDHLRRACAIADETFRRIVPTIRSGDTPRTTVARIARQIIDLGGDAGVVGPVTKAVDDHNLHAPLSDEELVEGDILHTELIPQYEGYSARIMRPVHVGSPTGDTQNAAQAIVALQNRQIATMRPGIRACDVDGIMREGMLREGLKSRYTNISGYTLGYYQLHTCRSSDFSRIFRPCDQWILQPGMVFHMVAVACGMGFSETVLVTEDGAERLTGTPRRILQAGSPIDELAIASPGATVPN